MKLLLFLGAGQLHAQRMTGNKIVARREFADTPDGRAGFAAFLQENPCPAYLLTDLIEEDFRQESTPHLLGRSRKALLQRKFEQFYHNTPFRQATLLQRQKTGRRDDDMLFSALTNPALVKPWLDVMLEQQTPLAGIYSVPQTSAPLIRDHPSGHLLLVSWEKPAGLRQTYFSGHRLQISRLTPVHAGMSFQQAVLGELTRTYQYLKSLSLLPPGQTLDVLLLGHSQDLIELQMALPRSVDMHYDLVDLEDLAKQHKIDYKFADSDATQVFLHQLAIRPPRSHYADAAHTHYFSLWQLRRALNLASGALLAVALLWGAANLWLSRSDATQAASLKAMVQLAQDEAQTITSAFPDTYAPAAEMKTAVSVMRQLARHEAAPDTVLHPLGAVLARYPQIRLDDLAWRMDAAEPVAPNTPADVPAQVIVIKGQLTGFANDYRAMLNYLENFQHDLTAQGYQVTLLDRPLDVSSSGSITGQSKTQTDMPGFSVKLARRPES